MTCFNVADNQRWGRWGRRIAIGWFAGLWLVGAQAVGGAQPAPKADASAETPPDYSRTVRVPAEVLEPKRRQVVILPSEPAAFGQPPALRSGGAIAKLPADAHRLPEGYVVANREARLRPEPPWLVADLAPVEGLPDLPPMRLLPNRRLEMLEVILGQTDRPPVFVLTGRVMEFQGGNYLLIELVGERARAADEKPSVPADRSTDRKSTGSGTSRLAKPPATAPAGRPPSPEEVIKRLLQDRPLKAVVLPDTARVARTQPAQAGSPDRKEQGGATSGRELPGHSPGTLLIDRTGRVLPGDPWWTLAFEDRGRQPADRPIRLLPNRLLETALALSGGGSESRVFLVSGEITVYHGQNYLLLRKVLVRRDFGNLR